MISYQSNSFSKKIYLLKNKMIKIIEIAIFSLTKQLFKYIIKL